MKQKLIIFFYFVMSVLGVFYLFYWFNRHKKVVLTYHNIIPDFLFDESAHLGVSHHESVFKNHIRLIKRRLNQQKVLITFDDGYKNQYEIASKMLEKHGLKGVFFITFKLIETGLMLTIDKIMLWISYVPSGIYILDDIKLTITKNNRHQIAAILYQHLQSNYRLWDTIENTLNHLYAFDDLVINKTLKRLRFCAMNNEDLSMLIKNGHIVAAHGWDHKPLSTLPIEMQQHDFSLCKTHAEKWCNANLYSYPYGTKSEVSPETMHLCKQYGFSAAYMNTQLTFTFSGEDINYQLPRLNLPNSKNPYLLEAKLCGFELFIKKWLMRV